MPRRDGFVGAALHDPVVAQQLREQPVREDVQRHVVDAGLHLAANPLLQRLDGRDQRAEVVAARGGIRARDVGR